jgi:hypothetical protein
MVKKIKEWWEKYFFNIQRLCIFRSIWLQDTNRLYRKNEIPIIMRLII